MKRLGSTIIIVGAICLLASASAAQTPADAAYQNGRLASMEGRWAEAQALYRAYLAAEPKGELADDALYWLAVALRETGDYRGALEATERLSRDFPESAFGDDALFLKGRVLEENLGRNDEAGAAYRDLLAARPTPVANIAVEAQRRLGDMELRAQRLAPAMEAYGQAKKEASRVSKVRAASPAASMQEKRVEERESLAQENYDFDGRPLSLYMEAERLSETGRCAEAVKTLDAMLAQFPRTKAADEALLLLGDCHSRLGDAQAARAAWDRLQREFPASPSAIRLLEREGKSKSLEMNVVPRPAY